MRKGIDIFGQKQNLLARRAVLFDAIVAYKRAHDGNSPSVRDLMAAVEYSSTASTFWLLERLEADGRIARNPNRSRHICVVGGAWTYTEKPAVAGLSRYAIADWGHIIEYKVACDGNSPSFWELVIACRMSSTSVARAAVVELHNAHLVRMPGAPTARHLEVVGGRWGFCHAR